MSTPLGEPIAAPLWSLLYGTDDLAEPIGEHDARRIADAVIAAVAAMPDDYTAVDVLAALRGECACGKPAVHLTVDPDSDEWACRVREVAP